MLFTQTHLDGIVYLNMRSITKQKNKKRLVFLALTVGGLLALGTIYLFVAKPFSRQEPEPTTTRPVNDIDYSPATQEEKKDSDQAKTNIVNQENNRPNTDDKISVTISRANQIDQTLSIRTFVNGISSGQCDISLTLGSYKLSRAVNIVLDATAYKCNVDIPISDFAMGGSWQLSIAAKNGNSLSPATKQNIEITK